jgi:hypothetical protein
MRHEPHRIRIAVKERAIALRTKTKAQEDSDAQAQEEEEKEQAQDQVMRRDLRRESPLRDSRWMGRFLEAAFSFPLALAAGRRLRWI